MRKYEVFYNFGKILNMTKTAEKLYISQSAVSQTIKELEKELNVKLFEKINKKNYLTHEGEIFFEYSKKILSLHREVTETIGKSSKIRIGASTTIGIYVLPQIIQYFLEKYNNEIEVSIKIENTENIVNYIMDNELDFAYIEGNVENTEILSDFFLTDELIFIDKYSESPREIKVADLENEKIILREKGSGTRDIFQRRMQKENIKFNLSFELGNTEAIKRVVQAGMGISCLSKRTVQQEIQEKQLSRIYLDDIPIFRDFKFIRHKDKLITNNMQRFIDFADNYKKNL